MGDSFYLFTQTFPGSLEIRQGENIHLAYLADWNWGETRISFIVFWVVNRKSTPLPLIWNDYFHENLSSKDRQQERPDGAAPAMGLPSLISVVRH